MRYKTRFRLFFGVMILMNLAANYAHPVTPTMIQNLHLHDYMFGVALAMMMVTNFLMSPFWGKLNGFVSSKLTMLLGCTGYGIAQLGFAFSTTELEIILARMFAGMFVGAIYVSYLTYIVNVSKPEDQGKFLTYAATIQTVAGAFGYLVGGFLGEFSVRAAFLVQAVQLIFCGILFFLLCEKDSEYSWNEVPTGKLVREANPFQAFIDSRSFLTAMIAMLFVVNIAVNFANTSFDQAFNYYLKDALGLTSSYNGIIKAGVGFVSFVANLTLCIWIIKKTRMHRSMTVLTGICALSAAGIVFAGRIGVFMAFGILLYAGYSVSIPVLQNMIAESASREQKNLVMGFYNATKSLGSIAGSLTAGFIYALDKRMPFVCTCVMYLAAFTAAAVYMTKKQKVEKQ